MLSRAALLLIAVYRYGISPLFGPRCRFHPSCSAYAADAIRSRGFWRGAWLACRRLARCHPWHPGGYDPVPHEPDTIAPASSADTHTTPTFMRRSQVKSR